MFCLINWYSREEKTYKSVSRYVLYCETSIAICIVSWGECIIAALLKAQFMTILSFDLQVWHWPSTYLNKSFKWHFYSSRRSNCAKSFRNPWINAQVIVWTSSIYDHFIIWPSSVTLTFNIPEQMVQMALLLIKEKNCAKLFCTTCIYIEVMAWTNPEGGTHAQCSYTKLKL